MSLPTNASQVQAFAGALYGIQVGTTTMAQVNNDILANGGLAKTLNSYYAASFGSVATATVAASVASNLGLTGAALTSGTAYITAQLNSAAAGARGEVISNIVNLFAGLAADATFGAAATAWNTKVAVAVSYTGAGNVAAGTLLPSNVNFSTNFEQLIGTAGNDTFNGVAGTGATISVVDTLDGGAGTDTLRVITDGALTLPGTMTSIERLIVNDTAHQSVNIATGVLATAGILDLTFQAGTSVDGATVTATIGSGQTLTLDGVTDGDAAAATVADGGISIAQAATLTTTALTLNDVGAATQNTALTIGLAGTGVTTANLTVTGANHVNLLNAGGAQTALNISGAGTLTTYTDLATTVTTVNGSAATGVLSLDLGGTSVRNVTGGTAADIFRLGADYVGGATGATRDIINGGDGRDTLSITLARAADTVATTVQSNLTSVEILAISDAWTTGVNIDLTKFATVDTVTLAAATAGTSTMTVSSGTTVTLAGDTAANSVTSFAVGGVGITDSMTLNMAGFDFDGTGTETFTGIETLNINTGSTVTNAAVFAAATTLTPSAGNSGAVINVSGANAMTFTGAVTAGAINASALTGILTVTAAPANAITITGGTAADVITGSAAADLITGGNGADVITGSAGNDSVVLTETTSAADKLVFITGANAAAVLAANGMDTITGFGSNDTLNIAALGDGTTTATGLTTVNTAAAQGALTDDTVVILNVAGTAASLTTGGTAAVTDFTNMTQVAAFLSERYTTTDDANQENVIVWNVGTTTYIYHIDTIAAGTTAIAAAEIVLLGTITQGAALVAANLVYA
jgi:hypothetical protein